MPYPTRLTEEQRANAKAKILPFRKQGLLQGSLRLTGEDLIPWRKTKTAPTNSLNSSAALGSTQAYGSLWGHREWLSFPRARRRAEESNDSISKAASLMLTKQETLTKHQGVVIKHKTMSKQD